MRVNHTYPALLSLLLAVQPKVISLGHSARALARFSSKAFNEAFGVKPGLIRTNEHGEILGHLTAFNGRHDDLLQSFGENT